MTARPMDSRSLVFLHPSDELYGADRMLLELVDAVPSGARVEVWLPTDLPHAASPLCAELERRGVGVRHADLPILRRAYRSPVALARLAGRVRRLVGELRAAKPEVVYCTTSATYLGIVAARRAHVPEVVAHVQEFWSSTDTKLLGPLLRRCDQILAISQAVADALPGGLGARAVVVPNATADPGSPAAVPGRQGPLRFVVASRWNGWKGYPTLLSAWELAGCPGTLTVLGGPPLSGDRVDVPSLAARLSDPGTVVIAGEVADPSEHLVRADVVIMPSDEPEPFGLVAIEAFARARPVIASAAGGLLEVVTDGVDGWLFPPKDAHALAALLRGLSRPDVERAARAARATYERRFTVERYREQWRAAVAGNAIEIGRTEPV